MASSFRRPVRIALWQGALRQQPQQAVMGPPKKQKAAKTEACDSTALASEWWSQQLRKQAQAAKAGGAELLVTPELCIPGYHIFGKEGFSELASDVEAAVCKLAKEEDIAMCVGFAEKRLADDGSVSEGSWWNTAILVDQQGNLQLRYRKHHLWGSEGSLGLTESSEDLQTASLCFSGERSGPCTLRIGLLICYDVDFPEMVRLLALPPHSVDLVLVPTALPYTETNTSTVIVPARAMENRIFVAYCNYPCTQRVDREFFCGQSCCAGPDGEFWCGPAGWEDERLLFCDIGWTEKMKWLSADTPYLRDRRPAFYASQGFCRSSSGSTSG